MNGKCTLKMAIAVAVAWSCANSSQATGWYHMPSSFLQTMGWGFGPGYHAPLVLGPHGLAPTREQKVIRLRCPPYAVGIGCQDCGACQSPMHGYTNYGDQMPADHPLTVEPQPSNGPSPAGMQWQMFGPPAPTAVGR